MCAPLPGPGHPNLDVGDSPPGERGELRFSSPGFARWPAASATAAAGRLRVPGLGLGLPIVAAIARAHHATLTISPRPGGGLNIDVTFLTATRPTAARMQRSSLHDKS